MSSSQVKTMPQITPETARVFLAEGDEAKKAFILAGLGEAGLAQNVQTASTWREAREFVDGQVPGELSADIFVFGAVLDDSGLLSENAGERLAAHLLQNYEMAFSGAVQEATKTFRNNGLTAYETNKLIGPRKVMSELAARRLQSEAVVVCLSSVGETEAQDLAQLPPVSQPVGQLTPSS